MDVLPPFPRFLCSPRVHGMKGSRGCDCGTALLASRGHRDLGARDAEARSSPRPRCDAKRRGKLEEGGLWRMDAGWWLGHGRCWLGLVTGVWMFWKEAILACCYFTIHPLHSWWKGQEEKCTRGTAAWNLGSDDCETLDEISNVPCLGVCLSSMFMRLLKSYFLFYMQVSSSSSSSSSPLSQSYRKMHSQDIKTSNQHIIPTDWSPTHDILIALCSYIDSRQQRDSAMTRKIPLSLSWCVYSGAAPYAELLHPSHALGRKTEKSAPTIGHECSLAKMPNKACDLLGTYQISVSEPSSGGGCDAWVTAS